MVDMTFDELKAAVHAGRGHDWPVDECGSCDDRAFRTLETLDFAAAGKASTVTTRPMTEPTTEAGRRYLAVHTDRESVGWRLRRDAILAIEAEVRASLDDRLRFHPITGDSDFADAPLDERLDTLANYYRSEGMAEARASQPLDVDKLAARLDIAEDWEHGPEYTRELLAIIARESRPIP